ncbi:MAG TPA: AAA-like domain-containing protein [Thermoanaerobaculia bacterium]
MTTPSLARVFLSYKRNAEPDERLAQQVLRSLSDKGYSVFIDRKLKIGQDWAGEIEAELRESDFLIVFLSEASSRSEMVKGEIEIARKHATTAGKPRILPVRVTFTGALPYPLNAYLDRLQYALWQEEADTARLLEILHDALGGGDISSPDVSLAQAPADGDLPPSYAAPLPPPGGALDVDDPLYLERPPDRSALLLLPQRGQTVVIKGPRQMGKSSLLMRSVAAATRAGKRAVLLDFQLLDRETRESSNLFFRRFLASIVEQLELPDRVDELWDSGLANPQNCTRYFERQILSKIPEPLTLAIDEADALFGTDFLGDFFGMIRSWHNLRANPVKPAWKKLDLILVASTEPYMLIDRPHESPFNVGVMLALSDFAPEQVQELNRRHGSPLNGEQLQQLATLLGGHPYLTRKALYSATKERRPGDLFAQAIDDTGPFGDHLRYYLLRLQGKQELVTALFQIVQGRSCNDESLCYRLEGAGLVKRQAGKVIPRCQLYADYFRERLHPNA